jgi:hypothetical protein
MLGTTMTAAAKRLESISDRRSFVAAPFSMNHDLALTSFAFNHTWEIDRDGVAS